MKINEVEAQLQISKANIRFYEKEGLLHPKRGDNGYRDYSKEDIAQLKKIIILRKLGVAIPKIRQLFEGSVNLDEVLKDNLETLTKQLDVIQGAVCLCKEMQKDEQVKTHLKDDFYWKRINEEQTKGEHFVDIVNDYLEFEKQSWIAMWSDVFFLPLDKITKKKGWLLGIGVVLLVCIARGVVSHLAGTGSFLNGFGYPFVLFLIIMLCTFPLYVLYRKYGDTELQKEKKPQRWHTVLKVIGALLYIPVVLFGGSFLAYQFITGFFMGDVPYIATGKLWAVYFIVAMYLFCLLVCLYSKNGAFGSLLMKRKGLRLQLPKKVKTKVLAVSIGAYCFTFLLCGLCFTAFTEDGVINRNLWYSKTYTWEDVDHYELAASWQGTLKFVIVMKDGFRADCLKNDITDSSLSEDKYPDQEDSYVKMLTKKFRKMGIPLKVKDWNQLKKQLSYDYWRDYADELHRITD